MTKEEYVDFANALKNNYTIDFDKLPEFCDMAISLLKENKGEWIELPKALNSNENPCECSKCGHILSFMNGYPKSNFCPNCGADMRDGVKSFYDRMTEKLGANWDTPTDTREVSE